MTQCQIDQLVQPMAVDSESRGAAHQRLDLEARPVRLFLHVPPGKTRGDEGPVAAPSLEQALRGEPFVNAQNGVLVHGQLVGERPDAEQPIPRLQ